MYCAEVMYPKKRGSSFNLKHYFDGHMPLGLGLLKKHCDVTPIKVEVDINPYGLGADASVSYHLIASLYFVTKAKADAFARLFAIEEASSLLKADWPKYTEMDPEIIISEIIEVDSVSAQPR